MPHATSSLLMLDWSAGLSNDDIYRLAREGTERERFRAISSILNDDLFENIERIFSCNEIEQYLPIVKFRRPERKRSLELALSYWKKGIRHVFPRPK